MALLGDAYTEEGAVREDLGTSILSGHPVLTDVLNRLPVTMELIVLSMAVALVIAIPAAIIGAIRRNTRADCRATSVAMVGVSIPEFFIGVLRLQHPHERLRRVQILCASKLTDLPSLLKKAWRAAIAVRLPPGFRTARIAADAIRGLAQQFAR